MLYFECIDNYCSITLFVKIPAFAHHQKLYTIYQEQKTLLNTGAQTD